MKQVAETEMAQKRAELAREEEAAAKEAAKLAAEEEAPEEFDTSGMVLSTRREKDLYLRWLGPALMRRTKHSAQNLS